MAQFDEQLIWQKIRELRPEWSAGNLRYAQATLGQVNQLLERGHKEHAAKILLGLLRLTRDNAQFQIELFTTLLTNQCHQQAFDAWLELFHLKPDWLIVHISVQNQFYWNGELDKSRQVHDHVMQYHHQRAESLGLLQLRRRFLRQHATAIGHLGLLDTYVKRGLLGELSSTEKILLEHPKVANKEYLKYWQRFFPRTISDPIAIELLKPILPYLEDQLTASMDNDGNIAAEHDCTGFTRIAQVQGDFAKRGFGTLLELSTEHRKAGEEFLRSHGADDKSWFVSFHIREGRVGLQGARDAAIESYIPAMQAIVDRGGWVIRMGDSSMTRLPKMERTIDYAHCAEKAENLDVFFWAACRFFVGTTSGPATVVPTFGVACVITNWLLGAGWYCTTPALFAPKLLYSEKEARYLTLSEMLEPQFQLIESLESLARRGLRLVDNSAADIKQIVLEMLENSNNNFIEQANQLQKEAHTVWGSYVPVLNANIGKGFLAAWHDKVGHSPIFRSTAAKHSVVNESHAESASANL